MRRGADRGSVLDSAVTEAIVSLAERLGCTAIICYGSVASGQNDPDSDIDLWALGAAIPEPSERSLVYGELGAGELALSSSLGNWERSWSPVNDCFLLQGQSIEIGFNTISWTQTVIAKLTEENLISFPEHSFRPWTFLGLVDAGLILHEKNNFVTELKQNLYPIPLGLKTAIWNQFFPILVESVEESMDYARRSIDLLGFHFHFFRGVDALIEMLYLLNNVYNPASKRGLAAVLKLTQLPPQFHKNLPYYIAHFAADLVATANFIEDCYKFVQEACPWGADLT